MPALADPTAGQRAGGGGRWGDLRLRVLSASVLAPLVLLSVWLGGWPWTLLLAAAAAGLGYEWAALCGFPPLAWPGLAVPAWLLVAALLAVFGMEGSAMAAASLGAAFVWWITRRAALAAGLIYLGLPVVALAALRMGAATGWPNLLFLVLIVWASDIGAYAAGRLLGGPKLAPAISPGKTWSGACGGLAAAVLVGMACAYWLAASAGLLGAALVAAALGIASQAGDLFESWIKRQFGVKDSGRLIPGHGGLLDRLDGLLAAAPVAASIAVAAGRGGALWQ